MAVTFRFPTFIHFGAGAIQLAPELLGKAKVRRPLVVTDKGLASSPLIAGVLKNLSTADFHTSLYAEAEGNPLISHVEKGVAAFRKHDADSVVLVGGGCALDVGKAIALMSKHPGNLLDYEDDKVGALPIKKELIPMMLAVPTTAGTGSEVGGSSVVSRDDNHQKIIVWGHELVPPRVIADPELTISLPPHLTAATGIDALTHNVEAFLAKNFHPLAEGVALEGVRHVHKHLVRAFTTPKDLEARGGMLLAAMMGATAFQKGLGVTHSCAHALSTCYDLHHGLANALMLIPSLEFNLEVVPEKFVRLGECIGLAGSNETKAQGFLAWLRELKKQLKIPSSLRDLNVKLTPRLVDVAVNDACHANNPRPCTRTDFTNLFKKAGAMT
ncbi:MAG: iron-containing alcohol dehydrogenase [Deltaproteobacteria bacterium]|nr:iron-containing alcohol dehydrogenase [Deltaproteobacteria bacterium]